MVDGYQTLLFVDDHHVLYRAGTRRVFCPAKRPAHHRVLAPTEPWEVAIGWTSIHRDEETGRYGLWYQAYTGDQRPTDATDASYAMPNQTTACTL